jgi:hypothetical protein
MTDLLNFFIKSLYHAVKALYILYTLTTTFVFYSRNFFSTERSIHQGPKNKSIPGRHFGRFVCISHLLFVDRFPSLQGSGFPFIDDAFFFVAYS